MARSMTSATSAGNPCSRKSGTGCEVIRRNWATTRSPLRRSNAAWPVNAQNRVAPSEYTSDAGVGVLPSSTSGAVNAGEPVMTPVAVWKPPAILAIPKSVSSGSPYSVSRMLPGLTSRCRMFAR